MPLFFPDTRHPAYFLSGLSPPELIGKGKVQGQAISELMALRKAAVHLVCIFPTGETPIPQEAAVHLIGIIWTGKMLIPQED